MTASPSSPSQTCRLPVILLTGFLGAGKTTLLLRWLRESPMTGRRLGVVMNEFGAESVDSQLIQRPGLPIRQVEGGCVCCADDQELDRACTQLAKSGECDFIVLETSGLADPDNLIDLLTDQDLLPLVQLQAVVAVVDAPWYARPEADPAERILARKQIQFAQYLCLSKCDKISPDQVDVAIAELRKLNPRAEIIKLPYGLPELGAILARPPASGDWDLTPAQTDSPTTSGTPHLHTTYQSVAFRFPVPVHRSAFEAFLSGQDGREVVRAKGFVRFHEAPGKIFVFQSVWGHHLIEEFSALPAPSALAVLIGPQLDATKYQTALRRLCFGAAGQPARTFQ